jgi:Porin PorA
MRVMKRVWPAWLLLFLGAFFLVTAGIAYFWAPDAAERTPLDSYQRTYLTGTADVLDPSTGKTNHDQVKITNITQVDDKKSTDSAVVFVTSTCVNVDTGDPADCLPKSDPRMISVSQLNFVADRTTAVAFDDPRILVTPVPVSGLVNKWPFHAEKKTYDVWDDVTKTSPPAQYAGETTIDGLKVYQYHQVISNAPIDLGNDIQGIYNLDETYSIDPVTGKIIDQEVHDVRTLKDGGDTALDLTAEYTTDTIQSNVDEAKDGAKQLTLITETLPIVGLVVGLVCVALGVFLLLRNRRRSEEPTEAPPAHAATPSG